MLHHVMSRGNDQREMFIDDVDFARYLTLLERSARRFSGASLLRDVLAHMPSEDFVDEGLIPDAAPACFLTELIEHSRIDSNRNDLARFVAERRPTDAPHGLQLVRRRIGNLREVNLAPRTPHARGDSPAVR